MPNYVYNKLKINRDVHSLDIFTDGQLDFDKIIPMPKELEDSAAYNCIGLMLMWQECQAMVKKGKDATKNVLLMNRINEAYKSLASFHKDIKEDIKEWEHTLSGLSESRKAQELEYSKKSIQYFEKYGVCSWYDWCCKNWNTKWNARDTTIEEPDTIYFSTAWSMPANIIATISKMVQGTEIEISWADEGLGENVGRAVFKNGQAISGGYLEPLSDEWVKIATEMGVFADFKEDEPEDE